MEANNKDSYTITLSARERAGLAHLRNAGYQNELPSPSKGGSRLMARFNILPHEWRNIQSMAKQTSISDSLKRSIGLDEENNTIEDTIQKRRKTELAGGCEICKDKPGDISICEEDLKALQAQQQQLSQSLTPPATPTKASLEIQGAEVRELFNDMGLVLQYSILRLGLAGPRTACTLNRQTDESTVQFLERMLSLCTKTLEDADAEYKAKLNDDDSTKVLRNGRRVHDRVEHSVLCMKNEQGLESTDESDEGIV